MYVQLLAQLFKKHPASIVVRLHLDNCPVDFFKELAKGMPHTNLRRIKLSGITTRYKYLAVFLRSCESTLRSLTLDHVNLIKMTTSQSITRLMASELKLERCVLRGINVDGRSLRFGKINEMRPWTKCKTIDGCGDEWVSVYTDKHEDHELKLLSKEGDDMRYWLSKAWECVNEHSAVD